MRTSLRVQLEGRIHFKAVSSTRPAAIEGEGRLRNVSTGGLCFITHERLIPKDLIDMTVITDTEELTLKGAVTRVEDAEGYFIVGVRFAIDDPVTEESLQMLAALGQD